MPSYIVVDKALFDRAVLATAEVSDPRSAVEAVPATTRLPERVVIVRVKSLTEFIVVEGAATPEVVVRTPPAAPPV